ncbi:hypothetical protein EBESD8_7640 [Rhodococcus aetherivorans]|nr:hypothetical protein EBESD8_7640 [Rhodococcus aetherivorans]
MTLRRTAPRQPVRADVSDPRPSGRPRPAPAAPWNSGAARSYDFVERSAVEGNHP